MDAQAQMVPTAEGEMTVVGSIKIDLVRPFKLPGIDIGRPENEHDGVTGFERHSLKHDRLCDNTRYQLHGSLMAQEFFDDGRNDRRIVDDSTAMIGMLGQKDDHAVQSGGNSV